MKPNMFEISKFVKWSVVGDGCVSFATHNRNAHYSITRSPQHFDYVELIRSKLEPLPDCSITISEYTRKDNNKQVISLRTSSHPLFTRVRRRQYIGNHRVLEPHLFTMLDWECLAFLYMDDGSLCFNNKGFPVVRISTCAYSYPEQMELRRQILERLGICFNVNSAGSGRYQLNLRKKDFEKFFEGVQPFMVESYKYKLLDLT